MNKAKQAEQERTEAAARILAAYLFEHKAWNWQWPGDGVTGSLDSGQPLGRNCWPTNNPKPRHYPRAPGTSAVGGGQPIVGTQTYYSKHLTPNSGPRWRKRASRRKSKRLAHLKPRRAHSYPGKTEGGY